MQKYRPPSRFSDHTGHSLQRQPWPWPATLRHSDKALNHLTFTRSTRKPLWGWECFRAEVDAAYD